MRRRLGPRDQARWLPAAGRQVRLFTRRGYDWSGRYLSLHAHGEAVVCGSDGVAVFDALHRRGTVSEAMLYAFEPSGARRRGPPAPYRWATARSAWRGYWAGAGSASSLSDHTDDDGATIFRHACRMGLEGIVSKRLTATYRSGPSRDWLKIKNPNSPAMVRHREDRW
jgi:bifunctional non-homologous end joining protein LigD